MVRTEETNTSDIRMVRNFRRRRFSDDLRVLKKRVVFTTNHPTDQKRYIRTPQRDFRETRNGPGEESHSSETVLTRVVLSFGRRETFGPRGAGHVRRYVSAGPVGVPDQTQSGQRLGPDRVHSGRDQPDCRTIVPEVRRERTMGSVQKVAGRPHIRAAGSPVAIGPATRLTKPDRSVISYMSARRS